jgi:hypothetical protein
MRYRQRVATPLNLKPNILVSGMIAGDPGQGGAAWAVLQYVLGFKQLGCKVHFVEPLARGKALDDDWQQGWTSKASADYFRRVVADFGLVNDAALLLQGTRETIGLDYDELCRRSQDTDVLINISGMLTDENLIGPIPMRVYLDLDPAFIQLWHTQGIDMRLDAHTHFVTVGLELGGPNCDVPTCGQAWIKTLQPIVLDHWPRATERAEPSLIAIGNWRGYGSVEYNGASYGQKVHSVRPLVDLPSRLGVPCRLAMAIHPDERADLEALEKNRWELIDPRPLTHWPADYQRLIHTSWAELGIAKSGYVASRCGWFSDRSVCFLASGRPVIAQETGFSRHLPTGNGLLAFKSLDDIVAAVEQLSTQYTVHSAAARELAIEYFGSRRVLEKLLNRVGAT